MIELIYNMMLIMLPVIYLINVIYNWVFMEKK
nr:MAG TPA: Chlorhexidine efflux transporter [Caudoviricetes sp.]